MIRRFALSITLICSFVCATAPASAGDNVFSVPQGSLIPQGSWVSTPSYTPPTVTATPKSSSDSTNLGGPSIFSFGSPAMNPVVPAVPFLGGGSYWGSPGAGLGLGGFRSTMTMGIPNYGYSGLGTGWGAGVPYGNYGGWGSYPGMGWGGAYSPFYSPGGYGMSRMHAANQKLGTLNSGPVIQSAPSKASGNFYSPSSTDSSASGSYYASDTPSYVPAPKPYSTGDNFWGGNSGSGSSSNSNPFPKDLNKTPW